MATTCLYTVQPVARPQVVRTSHVARNCADATVSQAWVGQNFKEHRQQRRTLQVCNFSRDRIDAEPGVKASKIPDLAEDREVMHNAYMHAFTEAQAEPLRIPGIQEFASGILARSGIPSQQYMDPLAHIFQEFDKDNDGHLRPEELAAALRSRNVEITDAQAAMFIDVVDVTNTHQINQSEFRDLVLHMAAADLHGRKMNHNTDDDGEWQTCSWELDDEIQTRLASWIATIKLHQN